MNMLHDTYARLANGAFLESLVAGDLVPATVTSSSKLHLIHVVRRVTPDMCKGEPSPAALAQMFEGQPVCEVRPRYWWRPQSNLDSYADGDRCRYCFQRWRSAGRPAIKGWAKPEKPVQSSVRLPWGWTEVEASSHPLDLPDDAPEPDPDEEEEKVGAKRKEVSRWLRGNRYVRIVQYSKDKRFCVRYGALDAKPTEETWAIKGSWEAALVRAVTTMALGGTWSSRTSAGLTLKDVQR